MMSSQPRHGNITDPAGDYAVVEVVPSSAGDEFGDLPAARAHRPAVVGSTVKRR